jgi:hypothetical protein
MCRSAIFFQMEKAVLLPAHHFRVEAIVLEIELQSEADPVDEVAALFGQLLQAARDRGISVRLQHLECQRLHLVHHLVHADPLGERGVDIHRLARDSAALVLIRDMMERAHVVQAVGQLHEKHADVVA